MISRRAGGARGPREDFQQLERLDKGAVLGSCSLFVRGCHMHIHECLWGRRNDGAEWVRLPDKEWTGHDGQTRHTKLITWESDPVARRFEAAALAAIHRLVEAVP
jgi:hypothetical protein